MRQSLPDPKAEEVLLRSTPTASDEATTPQAHECRRLGANTSGDGRSGEVREYEVRI